MGIMRATGSTAGSVYKAIGKPNIIFLGAIIQLIAAIVAVYFLIDFGIEGVALGMTISILFGVSYSLFRLTTELKLAYKSFFKSIQPALICSLVMLGIGLIFEGMSKIVFTQSVYIFVFIIFMPGVYVGAL
jgi:O-antigen/teichoic acid export membrane protein